MDDDVYRPIPCAIQDRYERAIITGQPLALSWPHDDRRVKDHVRILDLETSQGAEYVRFTDSRGRVHRVRLDHARLHDD